MIDLPDRIEILDRLRQVVPDKVGVDPTLMQPNVRLTDIGIDSYMLIELLFLAEEEFEVKIPLEGLAVKTIGDITEIIYQRLCGTVA